MPRIEPYTAHRALSVLQSHTVTPADERERTEVLRSFAVLEALARLHLEATRGASQD